MKRWEAVLGRDSVMFAPAGFRLVDDMTGAGPIGGVTALLDTDDGAGGWRETGIEAVITPSGVYAYPGLGRSRDVPGDAPRQHRFRVEAEFYRPFYRADSHGIEFLVPPYNDVEPPSPLPAGPIDVMLQPAANYPFSAHVPVLRGTVQEASGEPIEDALVSESTRERVLSDERGCFSLPLRWVPSGVSVPIDATHNWSSRTQAINVTLPAALKGNRAIVFP